MTTAVSEQLRVVTLLAELSRIDPGYRDRYHARAAALLAPVLGVEEYRAARRAEALVHDLLRQARRRVEEQDWRGTRSLARQIHDLQAANRPVEPMVRVARQVYEDNGPTVDVLAPGAPVPGARARVRQAALAALATLEVEDAPWESFYARRRARFERRGSDSPAPIGGGPPSDLRAAALSALDRGDIAGVERLIDAFGEPTRHAAPAGDVRRPAAGGPPGPAVPFSEAAEVRARRMGLAHVRVEGSEGAGQYVACCCVWQAILPDRPASLRVERRAGCTCGHACPPGVPERLRDTLDLLIAHPFVTSAGARYLPSCAEEYVLVEDFPETREANSRGELLAALGLERRVGLSRREIEGALLAHGAEIVETGLGLDLDDYRLVCIPFDLYARLGPSRGWGRQEKLWTHFDGYQVWKADRLRALAGGDPRFGGVYHLFSLAPEDEREEAIARFAVVRRARLGGDGDV